MTWDEQTSDAMLLRAWREGDKTAADVLITRLGPRLYNFFASKVVDGADALCQQALADCVADSGPLGPDGTRHSVRCLMFTAARQRLLQRLGERGSSSLDPGERSVADLDPRIDEVVDGPLQRRRLLLALRQLPVDAQVALELSYWERLTTEEIARVIERPEPEVEAQLARARAQLRGMIDDEREVSDRTIDARGSEDERG
ncbi:MAG: sigma-70 family RNA polymerase sigma factor [Myxococcota bacterium]